MIPRTRFVYVYTPDDWQGSYYTEDERIYVQYYARPIDNVTSLGFIRNESVLQYKRLQRKAERLRKEGYRFREGSVPNIHNYKNSVNKVRAKGVETERRHNEMCEDEYSEFSVVRAKRAVSARNLNGWHWLEGGWTSQSRGWKRSKKRKQWQ